MLRRTALLGALAMLLLASGGCVAVQPKADGTLGVSLFPPGSSVATGGGSASSGGGSTSSSGGGVKIGNTAGKPKPVGVPQTSGAWKINVEDAKSPKTLPDGTRPASGKQFLVVDVSIQNFGTSNALVVKPEIFKLADVHGAVIKPFPTQMVAFNAQEIRPLGVGMGGFTSFVYEVPVGSSGYGFTVSPPKPTGAGAVSWIVP
jgi:hypothetical protein